VSGPGKGKGSMTSFDEATAVRRRGDGLYDAVADARYAVVVPGAATPPAINGGALLATVLRAVLDDAPHPYPVATSAHFLRVPRLGPAQVLVSWLKRGKTAATARAALVQDDVTVLDTTVTTGTLAGRDGAALDGPAPDQPTWETLTWTAPPPELPDIGDCADLGNWRGTTNADGVAGYAAHVQVLLDPATTGWRDNRPSGLPEMRGYFRLREDHDPDAYVLAMAVDSLPPTVFGLGATGWAPTVELTWHMRAVPSPGPLRVAARCRHVSGGWFDEEAEVWDAGGRLVAQSRQLARIGRGRVRATVTEPAAASGAVATERS
jgi:Thioesterase-like superfamily